MDASSPKVFLSFFLEDKTSAPDVFSSCSFIPRADFEMSLVMVSCYGYEISQFGVKIHVFSTSFNKKSKSYGKIMQSVYLGYFSCKAQKITISCGFNLISNSW